jgi:pyruvate,orthophosphate dikinase
MAKRKHSRVSAKSKKRPVRKASRAKPKAAAGPSRGKGKDKSRGKWVYSFGDGRAEGKAAMRDLLGGKGAGLAEMASLG